MTTLGMPYSNHVPLVPEARLLWGIPGGPTHGPLNWPKRHRDTAFTDELVTGGDRAGRHPVRWARASDDPDHTEWRDGGRQLPPGVRLSKFSVHEVKKNRIPTTWGRVLHGTAF